MKAEIVEKVAALTTAAFGLVAALAWNSAIQKLFQNIFGEQATIAAMFLYAILVTALAVIITIYLGKAADKAKNLSVIDKLKLRAKAFKRKQ
ncbi:MAG: hypothetical protein KKD18_03330 [Nanoarchaeota archaeon]|nr:hypothetical protein [Nanoarchaeota archaeon]MBU0977422.1 hypothetical protein [Nanoarchaeota archaeon]